MSLLHRFFRDTAIYGLATVLPRVINFLLVKVHTDALDTSEYASNTDFYIWIAFFSVVLSFGMETTFFRFYNKEGNKDALISTIFIFILVLVISFNVIIFMFNDFFVDIFDFKDQPNALLLFIGILSFDTLCVLPFAYLRATNRPLKYTGIKLINVAVIVAINLIFLVYLPGLVKEGSELPSLFSSVFDQNNIVQYIFIANLIGSAISFLILLPYLFRFKLRFDKKLLTQMTRYSYPIVIAGISYIINENLDKFLIKRIIGDSEMGMYSACYKLAIFMNLYIMAFRLGAEPFFFSQANKKNAQETYANIMNYFVIVGSLVLLGVVAYLNLFKQFINKDYWEALAIVPIVLLANLFLGIYHNLSIWYKLIDKTYYGMLFSIGGAVLTIALNLLLLAHFGFIVSAWITLVVYLLMAGASYYYGQKHYPINYNLFKIAKYVLVSVILSAISFTYFSDTYLVPSIFVIVFISMIAVNERRSLQNLFR